MHIAMVAFDGFTDLDFYLPWDLLNRVRLMGLASDWKVEILGDKPIFVSSAGLELKTTKPYSFANECAGVLFCSGPNTRTLIRNSDFLKHFQLDPSRQAIAAIDSGALILGALNLLNGREATTYPTAVSLLEELGAKPKRASFVVDSVATAARCLSSDKLALWMIERLCSKEVSEKVYASIAPLD